MPADPDEIGLRHPKTRIYQVQAQPLGAAFPDIVATVRAGLHGAFEFTNIPPGDYAAFAFDRVPQQGAPEAFLGAAIARGQRVSVGEGGVESVEITVMRWSE